MVLIFYHFRHESGQPLSGFSAGFVSVSNFEKINFSLCCPKKKKIYNGLQWRHVLITILMGTYNI